LGIQFEAINAQPGEIVHRIVPEGESLEPCRILLEELHSRNPAFVLGYVPDCDGDRDNLLIWDGSKARALEAQEVFALACVAELAQLAWTGELYNGSKAAVAVNDPTSLRVDRIAAAFGAAVFRAEVGEANVVGLARNLRENGYTVRILGEGSAGGNITHPSAVRDPLHTVLALAKLLSLRTENNKPGLFELWCSASGQKCHSGYSLADVIASLPPSVTTPAYSPDAILKITSTDHGALKSRYQRIFVREWEERKNDLKARYGIYSWEAAAYNGTQERKGIADFGEAGKGGLKVNFLDNNGVAIASLWMRGSATEPVFRIMADADGTDRQIERDFIEWQRRMITEADRS
jgi:phosphoglucomutase